MLCSTLGVTEMIVLHSREGCRKLNNPLSLTRIKGAASLWEHLRKGHIYLARLSSAGNSIDDPWPRQELSLSYGETGIFITPEVLRGCSLSSHDRGADAPTLVMLKARLDGALLSLVG